jgi:hypothetical protein
MKTGANQDEKWDYLLPVTPGSVVAIGEMKVPWLRRIIRAV